MKLSLFLSALAAAFSLSALADGQRAEYTYTTTYRTWNEGFHRTYSYSEHNEHCHDYTCYYRGNESWHEDDNVYVRETVVTSGTWSGYDKVIVYTSSDYSSSPYCTYYMRENQVIYREFYSTNVYLIAPWGFTEGVAATVQNFDSDLQTLAIVGGGVMDLGVQIAELGLLSGDKKLGQAGVDAAILGGISVSVASLAQQERDQERTALQLQLAQIQQEQEAQQQKSH